VVNQPIKRALLVKHLLLLFFSVTTFTSVAGGNMADDRGSSAIISINGLKFFEASDVLVTNFSFGEVVEHDIEGTIDLNGQKTTFTVTVPTLKEGSYSKAENGSIAGVSLQYANMYLSSSGPFVPNVNDLGDYLIEITTTTNELIVGSFVANLQDGISTDTIQISGEFVLSQREVSEMEASSIN